MNIENELKEIHIIFKLPAGFSQFICRYDMHICMYIYVYIDIHVIYNNYITYTSILYIIVHKIYYKLYSLGQLHNL